MKKTYAAILAVLIFTLFQAVGGVVLSLFAAYTPLLLTLSIILSGLLTVLTLFGLRLTQGWHTFSPSAVQWSLAPLAVLGALSAAFAIDLMSEPFDLPNLMEEQFLQIARTPLGILALAIVGPVVEEVVFREAVLGNLLRDGMRPWLAILLSALVFGLIHVNPIQIPFALLIGIILGLLYCKTGNILLPLIVHILNNTLSVIEMNILGPEASSFSYYRLLGQPLYLVAILLLLAISCLSLRYFWTHHSKSSHA